MDFALIALLLAALPCHPPEPGGAPDPSLAAVYLDIARAEDGGGNQESAAAAYQRALELDPSNTEARSGLQALCAEADRARGVEEGFTLFREGRYEAAAERLEAVLAHTSSADAALLAGMARYELGHDGRALKWLDLAAQASHVRDAALVFKGLVLLREDRPADAAAALTDATSAADVRLRAAAIDLLGAANEARPIVLAASADSGWDSNVSLLPEEAAGRRGPSDASASFSASATGRPFGSRAPFLRATGAYRKYLALTDFDTAVGGVGLGWRFGGRSGSLLAEYGFDVTALANALWSTSHRGTLHGSWSFAGPRWLSAFASLVGRSDAFVQPAFLRYSGPRFEGAAGMEVRAGIFQAALAGRLVRSLAQDPAFVFLQPGAAVSMWVRPHPRARAGLQLSWGDRMNDTRDPDLGVTRRDTVVEGDLIVEWQVASAFALRAGVGGHRTESNVALLSWSRLTATVGVRGTAAFF